MDTTPPPFIKFFFFQFIRDELSSPPTVYISCALENTLENKIGEHQLVWLRDMTSSVGGGDAIFEEECVFFFSICGRKK